MNRLTLELRYPKPAAGIKARLRRWALAEVFEEYAAAYERVHAERADLHRRSTIVVEATRQNALVARQLDLSRESLRNYQGVLLVKEAELAAREAALIERSRAAHPSQQPPPATRQEGESQ